MSNNKNSNNGVNEPGANGEGLSPGRGYNEVSQVVIKRIPRNRTNTTRTTWTKEMNKIVMKCYIKSNPQKRNYRKRMMNIWNEIGLFELTEQKLAGQALVIKERGWLSTEEIEEIRKEVINEQNRKIIEENLNKEDKNNNGYRDADKIEKSEIVEINQEVWNDLFGESEEDEEEFYGFDESEINLSNINNDVQQENDDGMTKEQTNIINMLKEELRKTNIENPPNLRNVDRLRLKSYTEKVDKALDQIIVNDLEQLNNLVKAGGNVVARLLGIKTKNSEKKEPWWKRRITGKIKQIRKDLSRLQRMKEGSLKNQDTINQLKVRYRIKRKGLNVVIEELKERLVAKATKLKRYENRCNQYRQNRLFQNNQRKLFEELQRKEKEEPIIPEAEECEKFWNGIWGCEKNHNQEADWLKGIEEELETKTKQIEVTITMAQLQKQMSKLSNWKAPGPDGVQGYWLKNFKSLRPMIAALLNEVVQTGMVPVWLTTGKTTLIVKDRSKGKDVTNFRPITCLPLLWKLLTGMLAEEIYQHLEKQELLPEEQKGCRKKSRGTKDQLLIDRMILRNCKRRKTGLSMAWIDYKKAYDMVPHSCLENVRKFSK